MVKLAERAEKLMGMSPEIWQRHANPWSGWSRVAALPLISLALWGRIWIGGWALLPFAIALLWLWVNPRLFPPPSDTHNWMSQGVLGERVWLNRQKIPIPQHHLRMGHILNTVSALACILWLAGLVWLNVWATLFGMSMIMLAKLWFVDRMVWLYADMQPNHPEYAAWMKHGGKQAP